MPKVELANRLIVLTGASGAGKDEVMKLMMEKTNSQRVVTCCAGREPRPGEREGVDYHFLSREEFWEKINKGEFLEYFEYGETLKGTTKGEIEKSFEVPLIWRIDAGTSAGIRRLLTKENLNEVEKKSGDYLYRSPKFADFIQKTV